MEQWLFFPHNPASERAKPLLEIYCLKKSHPNVFYKALYCTHTDVKTVHIMSWFLTQSLVTYLSTDTVRFDS